MVKILDCTIRDSGYETNWIFDDEFVYKLIDDLNNLNVTFFEIGYRNHYENEMKGRFYNCTSQILEPFVNQKKALKIGVMVDTKRFSEEDFSGIQNDNIDFVRVACRSEQLEGTFEILELLHNRGYKVFLQLMDIYNVDADGYLKLFAWQNKQILESIYFADSKGLLKPDEIMSYYYKLKTLGYNNISFHAHNASNMALRNTQKAIDIGAYSIDISHIEGGRNGGNLTAMEYFNN